MNHEIELKLALGSEGPNALRRHPLLAELAQRVTLLGNTYYDTATGELETARMALRLRRLDGLMLQTVKARGEGGGGLSRRAEWEWRVPGPGLDLAGLAGLPPATLGEDVLNRLEARFTTDFRRTSWQLEHRGAHIELALDEGEILAAGRRVAIRELELELKGGEPATLWSLAESLADSVALRPSDTSKAARGGALLAGEWRLPAGGTPQAWLHRAVVALDALADTGQQAWRDAAREAFQRLTELGDDALGEAALRDASRALAEALGGTSWLSPTFGCRMLRLARRLPTDVTLN